MNCRVRWIDEHQVGPVQTSRYVQRITNDCLTFGRRVERTKETKRTLDVGGHVTPPRFLKKWPSGLCRLERLSSVAR
jgi:hypothetical protein